MISTRRTCIFRVGLLVESPGLGVLMVCLIAMALVTYTLLCGLASGLQNRFHPEVLGYSLSKALGVVITEFLIIRSVEFAERERVAGMSSLTYNTLVHLDLVVISLTSAVPEQAASS